MTTSLALRRAVHRNRLASSSGLLERLFTLWFARLVYTQIWEDPRVDREALALTPDCRVAAIASAGCNGLAYLADNPAAIDLVDLNPAHLALTRLKVAATRHLPDHAALLRFLGAADQPGNVDLYARWIAPHLDPETRAFWESRRLLAAPRLSLFARGLHRHGATNRFIGWLHWFCRLHGVQPDAILDAATLDEQRRIYEEQFRPLFDSRLARLVCRLPAAFYSLGIPPAQFDRLVADAALTGSGDPFVEVWRSRLARLATGFPVADNPFAWIAFGRRYDLEGMAAVPDFLDPSAYAAIKARTPRIATHAGSLTRFLAQAPVNSLDRFVLLDAQDWMTPVQLADLWRQIWRTARPDARVIFRTAASASPVEGLPEELRRPWRYDAETSRRLHAADRSAIYGGFHLYRFAG